MGLLKSHITTILLVTVFLTAGYFFLGAYNRCIVYDKTKTHFERQINLLNEQNTRLQQGKKLIGRVDRFLTRSKKFGINREDWDFYDVNINEDVAIEELKSLLNQCINSSSHYFKPDILHVKTRTGESGNTDKEDTKSQILLTLKGTFMTKRGP
jgi:hypothetical protein